MFPVKIRMNMDMGMADYPPRVAWFVAAGRMLWL